VRKKGEEIGGVRKWERKGRRLGEGEEVCLFMFCFDF